MKIKCPACSKVLSIPESAAGKVVKCPCGKQLRAPGTAPSQKPATSAPASSRPAGAGKPSGPMAPTRPAASAGDFDPAMFDELTDKDLKPVKGVANPYSPVASPRAASSKLLNQYAPRDGAGGRTRREIAGVGSRILGSIIDGLLINLFAGIGVGVVVAVNSASGQEPAPAQLAIAFSVASLIALIPWIVNSVMVAKSGQSLGKKLAQTVIVDKQTGATSGFVQGYLVRTIVFSFLTLIPFVGLIDIILLFSEQHQTLHDRMAKTLVVKA